MNLVAENNIVREAAILLRRDSPGDCLGLERSLIWRPVPGNSSNSLSLLGEIFPYSEFTANFFVQLKCCYHMHLASAVGYLPSEGRKQSFHPQDKRGLCSPSPYVGYRESPADPGRQAHNADPYFAVPFLLPVFKVFFQPHLVSGILRDSEPTGDAVASICGL